MSQQPSIFFVLLTSQSGEPLLVNIASIMYVLSDHNGGGVIYIQDGDDSLLCTEAPDKVAQLIQEAMTNHITGLTRAAYQLAREIE